MDKPTKPSNLMPRSFGGVKNNWSTTMQTNGYEDGIPAIYGGDNLNYQLDATGKELDYCEKIVDFIVGTPIGKTITVDANNKLVYDDLAQEPSIATTETVGVVKPDGETITITPDGTISSVGANQYLDNLTAFGNARLQYAPFAINTGSTTDGENTTLHVPEGSQTEVWATGTAEGYDGGAATVIRTFDTPKTIKDITATYETRSYISYVVTVTLTAILQDDSEIQIGSYSRTGSAYGSQTYTFPDVKYEFISPVVVKALKMTVTAPSGTFGAIYDISFTEQISVATSSTIICDPCTITTCDGRANKVLDSAIYDVSDDADGSYYVFKDITTGALSLIDSLTISKTSPLTAFSSWLDYSTFPANLKILDNSDYTINNDLVWIGNCTVSSGIVTSIKNRYFNACPYRRDLVYSYKNGSSWCDIYSDDWCEQGGAYDYGSNARSVSTTINLLQTYLSTNYTALVAPNHEGSSGDFSGVLGTRNKTTSSFEISFYGLNSGDSTRYLMWQTSGYIN